MKKNKLHNIIQTLVHEYTGTGASGGNAGDGNSIPSQRLPGGSFATDAKEREFYNDKGAPYGGAEGNHYRKDSLLFYQNHHYV